MTIDGAATERAPRFSGLTLILMATVAAGIASYLITWLVPRQIGFASYAVFAVFWSFTYLMVGALGGIQQEVARGTGVIDPAAPSKGGRARNFALVAAGLVFVAVVATAPFWVGAVFPVQGWSLVFPLAVGAASYVLVAVLAGSLYGIGGWVPLALMLAIDSILRFASIAVALAFTNDVVVLAWCVAVPFPATILALWPFIRRSIVGRTELDVGYARLARNVAQTVVAAAATGVMVSGFPLILGLTSPGEPKAVVGLYILCITLTRAPLIIVLMSLQSYLLVTFRDDPGAFGRRFAQVLALILGAGALLSAAGWLAGPAVFAFLFPGELVPDGWLLAVLVFSSAIVGTLNVTGPALLARGRHFVYSAGWVVAAITTVVILLLPLEFTLRTILALLIAPAAGLIVHGAVLAASRRRGAAI